MKRDIMNKLSTAEIFQAAEIHKKELGGADFLSSCSKDFISYFYSQYSDDESNKLLIVKDEDQVAGFVFLSLAKNRLFGDFLKRNLTKILLTPSALFSLFRTVLLKSRTTLKHKYDVDIVYIAVGKKFQSKGYARKLLGKVEEHLKAHLISTYCLQVFKDNNRAVAFYEKYGFETIEEYSARGRIKLLMRKNI